MSTKFTIKRKNGLIGVSKTGTACGLLSYIEVIKSAISKRILQRFQPECWA